LALLVVGVYRTFLAISNASVAALLSLTVVVMFGFAQVADIGNYTYVCPYSHEAVHGGVALLLMIGLLHRWMINQSVARRLCAGLACGFVFLTKPELFVAAAGVVLLVFGLHLQKTRNPVGVAGVMGLFFAGGLLPLAGFFLYFNRFDSVQQSLLSVCGAWVPLFTSDVAGNSYYRWGMGLDSPWYYVRWIALHIAVLGSVVAALVWRFRKKQSSIERSVLLALVGIAGLWFNWAGVGTSLPLLVLFVVIAVFWRYCRRPTERDSLTIPLLWSVCGLLMLAKMGLHCRIWHYGFVLAMPAFISTAYFLIWLFPRWLESFDVRSDLLRAVICCWLLVGLVRVTGTTIAFYANKSFPVGSGADRLYGEASVVSQSFVQAVDWINKNVSSRETLAVLPEGAMINYISRRTNPTPYPVFMAEVSAFGEDTMFAAYRRNPPDFIALVHRDASEYGVKFFGTAGYGAEMMKWIDENYQPVFLAGNEPFQSDVFGIKILRKIKSSGTPGLPR
jgi:hypothetical protein